MSFSVSVRVMFSLFRMYSPPQHRAYYASGSSTSGIICTGWPFSSELSIKCVCWSTGVYTSHHQPTLPRCPQRHLHRCVGNVSILQHTATWQKRATERRYMVKQLRCLWSDPIKHTTNTDSVFFTVVHSWRPRCSAELMKHYQAPLWQFRM